MKALINSNRTWFLDGWAQRSRVRGGHSLWWFRFLIVFMRTLFVGFKLGIWIKLYREIRGKRDNVFQRELRKFWDFGSSFRFLISKPHSRDLTKVWAHKKKWLPFGLKYWKEFFPGPTFTVSKKLIWISERKWKQRRRLETTCFSLSPLPYLNRKFRFT